MKNPSRRGLLKFLLVIAVGLVALVSRPFFYLFRSVFREKNVPDYIPEMGPHVIEDASRLDRTEIAEVWKVPGDLKAAEAQLKELVGKATREGVKISVAGARHTMGGQVLCPQGIVVDTSDFNKIELDSTQGLLHVYSGARWRDVLSYLDPLGYSVSVMQSNNDFSVGGSLGANCHGWQSKSPPIVSTVDSFRILLSNGEIKRCSRKENADLFSNAIGGYGLFGIMLDVNLKVVRNENYLLKRYHQPSHAYASAFETHVEKNEKARMAFGRLSVDSDRFLTDSMLNVFYLDDQKPSLLQKGENDFLGKLTRAIFRSSIESEYGKRLRWNIESGKYGDFFTNRFFSRNRLFNVPVTVLQEKSPLRTDILHEYFVPKDSLEDFLKQVRRIVPHYKGELLNVTIRDVKPDADTVLKYSKGESFGLVMLFNYPVDREIDVRMGEMTRELIDVVYRNGGTYYLPYRLHATREQFRKIYPTAEGFFRQKKRYDPQELFQNQFYLAYK